MGWCRFKAMWGGAGLRLCGLGRVYVILCGLKLNFNFLHVIRVIENYLLR